MHSLKYSNTDCDVTEIILSVSLIDSNLSTAQCILWIILQLIVEQIKQL